jgi:hypothetical protein
MPAPCQVCSHRDRAEVDLRLLAPRVNQSQLAREYGLKRDALRRHLREHLSRERKLIYSATADLPSLGELHGEYLRLYSAALDNLARAESGVLIDLDDKGNEHRRVSPSSISRAIREARTTVDRIVSLAADAGERDSRPVGVVDGELSARIGEQLKRVIARSAVTATPASIEQATIVDVGMSTRLACIPAIADNREMQSGEAGGLSGELPPPSIPSIPLDAVIASGALSPRVAQVIADDERSTTLPSAHEDTPVMTVPNPRYPGSAAASPEERATAGFPDLVVTLGDLKSNVDLVSELVARHRRQTPDEGDPLD